MRDLRTYGPAVLQQIIREGWQTDKPNDCLSVEARSILRERGAMVPWMDSQFETTNGGACCRLTLIPVALCPCQDHKAGA